MATGLAEITRATRQVVLEDALCATRPVVFDSAGRVDFPYIVLSLTPMPPVKKFGGGDRFRWFRLQAKVCATMSGGQSAMAIAEPLRSAIYDRFTQTIDGLAPDERLNVYLNPVGWRALYPLEVGDIQPYKDRIGDAERWHMGNLFDLRIAKL